MVRAALFAAGLVVALAPLAVRAAPPDVPPPAVAPQGADAADAAIAPLVAALRAAKGEAARLEAAAALAKAAPGHTAALAAVLATPLASTDEARRAVLKEFRAEVPTPDGKFKAEAAPRLKKGEKPPPDPDWLAELARLPGDDDATRDCLVTVAVMRALAASQDPTAADAILAFAFTPTGITFRDEAGRQLRAMSPYSLPTLVRASQEKKIAQGSYARYSMFQLERLDKNRPSYALEAAPDDALEVAILQAIAKVHHPDAVGAVLERCEARSSRVRRAAREAWQAFVSGPPPPPAPKAKRKLPGGKMSDEELPLYLTYRELARQELLRRLDALGAGYDKGANEEDLTRALFTMIDAKRVTEYDQQMTEAKTLADAGKVGEAAARYDQILVVEPTFARRAEMTPVFLAHGEALGQAGKWAEASLALEKAYSLDPEGPGAAKARGALHFARAKVLEAAGRSGADELAQAVAADPSHGEARDALGGARREEVAQRRGWMLWAGLGGLAVAIGLGLLGAARRKRAHA